MAGFYEGYLNGLRQISGLRSMEQQQNLEALQIQKSQEQMEEHRQEKSILANVFRTQANDRTAVDVIGQHDQLARQYRQAGHALMGVNPRSGLALIQEADSLRQKTQLAAIEQVKAGLERDKYLGKVASNVFDQDSLNDAISTFAKHGKTIPTRYQTWGEETAQWFERQSVLGVSQHEQQTMRIQQRMLELKEDDQRRKDRLEEDKIKTDASREARLREGLEIKRRASTSKATLELGMKTDKDIQRESLVLSDMDESGGFKALPPGKKIEAVQDVHMRAQKLRADSLIGGEEPVSPEDALRLAREEVLGEIKVQKGGWFSSDKAVRETSSNTTSQGEKKSAAADGMTAETALLLTSDAEYNQLPSGIFFKGPDGKLRRKP